jgi:hypothetical protein
MSICMDFWRGLVSDPRDMLELDNRITRKDNKDGLFKQNFMLVLSRYGWEEYVVILRRHYFVPSYLAMSGFSVFKGAAQLIASLPFSHRPFQPEGESVGAVPLRIFNFKTIWCSVVERSNYLGDSKQNYKHENTGAGLSCRGYRNLALYLPRLAFLVSIEADRPRAWFPGPLGPYTAWFSRIDLSWVFERVKVPGNPMKSPFCFWYLLGVKFLRSLFSRVSQPNHEKHLLSGLKKY